MYGRMVRWLSRRIERWSTEGLPEAAQPGARVLVRAWVIAIIAIVLSTGVYAAGGSWGQLVLAAGLALSGVGCLAWFVRSRRIAPVTHVSLVAATLSFGGSTLAQMPPDITNVAFLAVVPLTATLVLGMRAGRVWLVIELVVGAVLLVLAEEGVALPFRDETPAVSHAMNIGLLMVVTWLYARSFVAGRAEAMRRVRDADRAKSAFLATVSHEIRTPMNAVLGMTDVVLDDVLEPRQRERLMVVKRSGALLVSLVNDVLDVMKLEARKLTLEATPFDLGAVLADIEALYRVQAEARGLTFRLTVDAALAGRVVGDPLRLTQILGNLVANAVKFTERGGVSLSARRVGSDGVAFAVEDTGPGIDPAVLATLFARFQQAAAWTTRRHGGTGLGLVLAQELVGLMGGGRIEVATTVGVGSRFAFEVPLRTAVEAAPQADESWPDGAGRRVLVVDDNPINVAVVTQLLERAGCRVDAARNGREALARATAGRYELVLMDLYMPDMDGLEVTRRLRAAQSEARATPIVGLTASAMPDELAACRAVGMSEVVTKPITPLSLKAALGRAWGAVAAR